jgi:hypothetical protein
MNTINIIVFELSGFNRYKDTSSFSNLQKYFNCNGKNNPVRNFAHNARAIENQYILGFSP